MEKGVSWLWSFLSRHRDFQMPYNLFYLAKIRY